MKKMVVGAFILIIIGIIGTASAFYFSDIDLFHPVKWNEKKTVQARSIENVTIQSSFIDAVIEKGNSDDIQVELAGKESRKRNGEYDLIVDQDGDSLQIKVKHHIKWGMTFYSSVRLYVKIPEKMYDSITVNTTSGDVVVEDFTVNNATFQSNSGDVVIKQAEVVQELEMKTTSGDIKSGDISANNILMKASSGDIETNKAKAKNQVKIQGSSGDIIGEQLVSKKAELTVKSGDIKVEDIMGDISAKAQSGDIRISPNEKIGNMNLETTSGDAVVDMNQNSLPFSIDFKAGSGEAHIKTTNVKYKTKEEHQVVGEIANGGLQLIIRTTSGDFQLK